MPRATIEKPKPAPQAAPIAPEPAGVPKVLRVSDIELDPAADVRPGPVAKDEPEQIDALARAIYEQGQLQPVVVRPNGSSRYKLIAGRRRLAAIRLIEEKTSTPWPVQAMVVNKNDDEAWDAAFAENFRRRNFSPIELAQNIVALREKKSWTGDDWTRHAADYLRISRATVTQHMKLLTFLPDKVQDKVHSGLLSMQAALDLVALEEEKRKQGEGPELGEVLAKAEAKAEAEEIAKRRTTANDRPARVGTPSNGKKIESTPVSAPKAATPPEKGKVKRRHVLAAARETSETLKKPRTRTEIVGFFTELTGPASPEVMGKFASALVDKWLPGQLSDKALLSRWYAIAELVEKPRKAAKKN